MKTLVELRMEVELGIEVYPSSTGEYSISRVGGTPCFESAFVVWYPYASVDYPSFDALLCALPDAYLPIWTITKTPAHIQIEQEMKAMSEKFKENERGNDVFEF